MNVTRWQFSLLGLLGLTTAVALYLTFANHYPWLAIAIFFGGAAWAALLLFADRLLLAARSRWWVLITAGVWALAGTTFLLLSLSFVIGSKSLDVAISSPAGVLCALFAIGALVCYLRAWRGYSRFSAAKVHTQAGVTPHDPS